jgi:hypothetical protein
MRIDNQPIGMEMDELKDQRQTVFSGLEQWDLSKTKEATNNALKDLEFIQFTTTHATNQTANQAINQIFSQPQPFQSIKKERSLSIEANCDDHESRIVDWSQNYSFTVRTKSYFLI